MPFASLRLYINFPYYISICFSNGIANVLDISPLELNKVRCSYTNQKLCHCL